MFDQPGTPASADALRSLLPWLDGPLALAADDEVEGAIDDAEAIEQIAALERAKAAMSARQARLSVAFDGSQRARQRAQAVPAAKVGRGVADQIALARQESPTAGSKHLSMAKSLVNEMPHTLKALSTGQISEWSATLAVRETACLSSPDRMQVDAELAERLPTMSPAEIRGAAWGAACRLDSAAAAKRCAKATNERYVSIRPAPDTMTYVTALLPVKDGVACYAALNVAANGATATGDPRTRGQLMADAFVDRVTGRQPAGRPRTAEEIATATATAPTIGSGADVAIEVHLVVTHETLLAEGDAPALLTSADPSGSNPAADLVPATVARDLVGHAAKVWLRRLYTDPQSGQLVAMESTRRVFDGNLRRMLILRDGRCRTPWCNAPIRQGDHVKEAANGGPTSYDNGQGLCERCNQTKSLPGWSAEVQTERDGPPGRHVVRTTTPTGRTYTSTAPPLLGHVITASTRPEQVSMRHASNVVLLEPRSSSGWHPSAVGRPA
jgi:hypothetical protein